MATPASLLKAALNVKDVVVFNVDIQTDKRTRLGDIYDETSFIFDVRPYKKSENICPHCGRVCPRYDQGNYEEARCWRALDWGANKVYLRSKTHRVACPDHGVVTAAVPWAFADSRFTKNFDLTVTWLASRLSKSDIAFYMDIDWKTVGRCIRRTLDHIEPNQSDRLKGLVNIGVDETSFRKGHKYITVVVNHDTNSVVWVHESHGKEIFRQFFEELSQEDRLSIKTISGDGARWIDECMKEYTPNAIRCTDPFHVVSWAGAMLDDMRRLAWNWHRAESRKSAKEAKNAEDDAQSAKHAQQSLNSAELAKAVKGALYALGKAPENLTERQSETLELIQAREPKLFKAYQLKEELRAILHLPSYEQVAVELKRWYFRATHSRLEPVKKLAYKIRRHEQGIINAVRYRFNNARIEATNNKIKLAIRRAFGFRNIDSLIAMVMLVCSPIKIPLPNRPRQR